MILAKTCVALSPPCPIFFLSVYRPEPAAPGTGPTLHLAVPDTLEATAARCEQAGGTVKSDAITIPPGRFIYVEDPDGNSLGLFEFKKA